MNAVPRVGGRLLLIDPDMRVLLIHERLEHGGTHWLTPGGGVESGEVPADAAVRETAEEVGFDAMLPVDAEPVLVTQRLWSWAETVYDQTDHFFLLQLDAAFAAAPRHLTETESCSLLGHRWWTADELRSTEEIVLPVDLADLLTPLLRSGNPDA